MQKTFKLLDIDLQLFNGAAAGGAAAGAAGDAGASAQGDGSGALPKAGTQRPGSSRRGKSGEYDNVVFGIQEDASGAAGATGSAAGNTKGEGNANKSGVSTTSDTLEAKRAAFEELINGEYKDQFTEKFQSQFNRRFREAKSNEEQLAQIKPILDTLFAKHQITDGDIAKLQAAIDKDDSYVEKAADDMGLTPEQYRDMQRLKAENAEWHAREVRRQGMEAMQQQLADWTREGEQIKAEYPDFNLDKELQNADFRGLLKAKIPLKQAYELMHMDEIKQTAARSAAQQAGQRVAEKVRSRASRPAENGTSSQTGISYKPTASTWNKKDRAEVARRVERGEIIKL